MTQQTGAKHTPLPWREHYDDNGFYYITADEAPSPYIVATGNEGDGAEADAKLIVTAVNAYSTLIASVDVARLALENAEAVMSYVEPRNEKAEYLDCLKQIRSALSSLPTAQVKG